MSGPTCTWCDRPIGETRQGLNKRFCSTRCRQSFHEGCRLAGKAAFDRGDLTIPQLRELANPGA